jgi:monofunctional biosynthetic peptidoglycan transglycosylase
VEIELANFKIATLGVSNGYRSRRVMTSLKGSVAAEGDPSPEIGVRPELPADSVVIADNAGDAVAEARIAEPHDPVETFPLVLEAATEAAVETSHAPIVGESAALTDAPIAFWPAVMPEASGHGGTLRVIRAEVVHQQASEPVPPDEVAAAPPAIAAPIEPAAEAVISEAPVPVFDAPAQPADTPSTSMPPFVIEIAAPAAATTFNRPAAEHLPAPAAKALRPAWRRWTRRAALTVVGLAAGYTTLVLLLIVAYRGIDPPMSTLMLELRLRGEEVDYRPVPLTSISSYLQRAVVTSEDARFCSHRGVDWGALAEAIQDSRGGSTITMQTAKNLFLWPSRSYIRKAIEIPIALTIDFAWPKRRVLEVYLNIAEWGPGIFGAEAAAQYHFNKSAARLTQHEATLLAASLPNPIARDAGEPGRIVALLASRLRARMANSDAFVSCLGLRHMPRSEPAPVPAPRSNTSAPSKPAAKPAPWKTETTRTEPARPINAPLNPW